MIDEKLSQRAETSDPTNGFMHIVKGLISYRIKASNLLASLLVNKVKVSSSDTTEDYLDAKIDVSSGQIQKTIVDTLGIKKILLGLPDTISKLLTFSVFPVTPSSIPGTDYQVSNKKYVDDIAALKAALSGATFTGDVSVSKSAPNLNLNSSVPTTRSIRFRTNLLDRWLLYVDSTAEGGSNTGSDFFLSRRSDAGAGIDAPLQIIRSSSLTKMTGVYGNTTASAANVFVGSDGSLLRSTSSEKYKEIIEAILPEWSKNIYEIAKKCTLFYKSKSENDNPEWTWYGLSAEKLAEIEPRLVHWGYFPEDYEIIEKKVIRKVQGKDEQGQVVEKEVKEIEHERVLKKDAVLRPSGVQYNRFVPLMLVEMNRQNDEIQNLKNEIAEIKKLLKK